MQYTSKYESPLGGIILAADEVGLTELWFEGQKYFALYLDKENEEKELPVFEQAEKWLDIYFNCHTVPIDVFCCRLQGRRQNTTNRKGEKNYGRLFTI